MWTRDEYLPYDPWLGLYPEGGDRPEVSRAAGMVTPAAILAVPTGLGMDPLNPSTHTRPYAPQRGMFARLHQDEAAAGRKEGKR